MTCQYERLTPKHPHTRSQFPTDHISLRSSSRTKRRFVFRSQVLWTEGVRQHKSNVTSLRLNPMEDTGYGKVPRPSTRNATKVLKLQPSSEDCSQTCRKHLASFLSSACKLPVTHSHCTQGLTSFRSTMNGSKL